MPASRRRSCFPGVIDNRRYTRRRRDMGSHVANACTYRKAETNWSDVHRWSVEPSELCEEFCVLTMSPSLTGSLYFL